MRMERLFPMLMAVAVLAGCEEPPASGKPEATPEPMSVPAEPVDRLPRAAGGSVSDKRPVAPRLGAQNPREPGVHKTGRPVDETPKTTPFAGDSEPAVASEGVGDDITRLRDQALYAQEPEARIKALQGLVPLVGEDADAALPVFEEAMRDNDEQVREEALRVIYRKSLDVPTEVIHEVAISDPVDVVRGRAWIAIVERGGPELRNYLADALKDPNPDIRRDAQWELDKLDKLDSGTQ